jgi:xanthine dehydrogenase accessory factor
LSGGPPRDARLSLPRVLILGAGDLATGVAHRLHASGFEVALTELAEPRAVRRAAAFAEAVYEGAVEVEGVRAVRVTGAAQAEERLRARDAVPVLVDPEAASAAALRPGVLVDARLLKKSAGLRRGDVPLVIALGPGFTAGEDADAVVETNRGSNLGRVYWSGRAEDDTGVPAPIGGASAERVFRAPAAGVFLARVSLGDRVKAGEEVGSVGGAPVPTRIAGMVRGLLRSGLAVAAGEKLGDIDPRPAPSPPGAISDKSRAVAGGVLEAILSHLAGGVDRS